MYFEGVGTLCYEPPPPELKPFFRRKYATAFRSFVKSGDGLLTRNDFIRWADRASNQITDLDEKKDFVIRHIQLYDNLVLFGKQSINEQGYINEFLNLAFSDAKTRRLHITSARKYMPDFFALGDTNKDGHIDYKEFCAISDTFDLPLETIKTVFDALDSNKDGKLSLEDYSYCLLSFFFHSGPDDPISLFYGELVENSSIMAVTEHSKEEIQQRLIHLNKTGVF